MVETDPLVTDDEDYIPPDESATGDYPQVASGAKDCAKDFDNALLQHCTVRRMREIAKDYEGVDCKLNKGELFKAVFDAMTDSQDCRTCPQGNCEPRTHYFPPMTLPPEGWIRGINGLYTAPQQPPTTQPPTDPVAGASGTQQQVTQPGSFMFNTTDPFSGIRRPGSPSSHLLRSTGTINFAVASTAEPVVHGLIRAPSAPPDVASLVRQGATHTTSAVATAMSSTVQQSAANTQADIDRRIELEIAEERRVRDLEAQQLEQQIATQRQQAQQQSLQSYEAQRRQQLLASRQADAQAHELRMQQLRASLAATPASLAPPTATLAPGGFLATPTMNLPPPPTPPIQIIGTNSPSPFPGSPAPASPAFDFAQLDAYFDRKMQAMGHGQVPPALASNPYSPAPYSTPFPLGADRGSRPLAHKVTNAGMASRFGVLAQPLFEVTGSLEGVDMAKMAKIMTPGFDTTGPGFVLRQHRLPHRSLQTTTPGHMTAKHSTLTFHQLMNGWLSVAMLDTPDHKLDPELANKLSFQQFMISMSFHFAHKDVLQLCNTFIWSWQMREFEWSDPWPQLEERLKSIRSNFIQKDQPHTYLINNPPRAPGNGNGGGGGSGHGGGGGNPKKQPSGKRINGVPTSYMKEHNICIRFNSSDTACKEPASHKNEYAKEVTLAHICAGCHAKSKAREAHRCHNCGNGPFSSLF